MDEVTSKRSAKVTHYGSHGLHDYASVREARITLQNSSIHQVIFDRSVQADMAEWMWRNLASPEDAAIALHLKLPGG